MTARALSSEYVDSINTGATRPVFFYEGVFAAGTVHLFTGYGTITWDSKVWTGGGGMLKITPVQETSELRATNFTVSLNGNLSEIMALALDAVRRGKSGKLWLGLLDTNGALLDDPYLCFSGRADKPDIVPDPNNAMITMAYESRMIVATRRKVRRYTTEDQRIDFPDDKGFDYVPSMQDAQVTWGQR